MTTKEDRVQKVVDMVETILVEIANEHDSPQTMAPAMVVFFVELSQRLMRMSHERLQAFLQRKVQPDD